MSDITERLKDVFTWIEGRDMRVAELWLHPKQVAELNESSVPGWDKVAQQATMLGFIDTRGALFVGLLWGASVFESAKVVENHVAALPDGWIVDGRRDFSCMPF